MNYLLCAHRLVHGGQTRASAAAPGVGALLASFSLKPPTCAVQKVGSFLRYTDRNAKVVGTAAFDPEPT